MSAKITTFAADFDKKLADKRYRKRLPKQSFSVSCRKVSGGFAAFQSFKG